MKTNVIVQKNNIPMPILILFILPIYTDTDFDTSIEGAIAVPSIVYKPISLYSQVVNKLCPSWAKRCFLI